MLANNNVKDIALKYLELASHNKETLERLKDRIVGSDPRAFSKNYGVQKFPFPTIEVKVLMPLRGVM